MKTKIIFMAVLQVLTAAMTVQAQNKNSSGRDSSEVVRRLNDKKAELTRLIAAEDRKRDQHIEGVSWEKMKEINERQDSLCLQLRSELNDVDLELKELKKSTALSPVQVLQRAQEHHYIEEAQQALTPSKPVKPTKKPNPKRGKKKKK